MSNRFIRNRFLAIIDKYLKGQSTSEQNELVERFYDSIQDDTIPDDKLLSIKKDIKIAIDRNIEADKVKVLKQRKYVAYLKIASCLAVISLASFYVYQQFASAPAEQEMLVKNDGEEVPVVVLNDGKSFQLKDSLFGELAYELIGDEKVFVIPEDHSDGSEKLSQIRNPTNKIFAFLLQDGTKAWLNPNSSLEILPEEDHKRIVRIDGTVLFDVQRIKANDNYKPFVVKTALQTIEVLGTRFIVNSTDKANEDVLLLEGKVKLTHNHFLTEVILKPDQKASLKIGESKILVTRSADSYKVEAWHKGLFHFENEKIADVMAEIAQWYEKDIIVDKSIREIPITGMLSRYKNIDEVLQIIEMTNNVKYVRSGERIYIK
jgi:transmembrane sensor